MTQAKHVSAIAGPPGAQRTWPLARLCLGEAVATAFLLMAVVGSGIMAERLSGGNGALALLANSLATGAALFALIVTFGAHMNPLVTLLEAIERRQTWLGVFWMLGAQLLGAVVGVVLAHAMFEMRAIEVSGHERTGLGQWLGEAIATFGLITLIIRTRNFSALGVAASVGAYIMAAYWFTASTSFANPAVTLARTLTNTFAGIAPANAAAFIAAQIIGLALAKIFVGLNARPG